MNTVDETTRHLFTELWWRGIAQHSLPHEPDIKQNTEASDENQVAYCNLRANSRTKIHDALATRYVRTTALLVTSVMTTPLLVTSTKTIAL